MNRISELFQTDKPNLLNIYFTAGFPELDSTLTVIRALDKAGVDLIEIGMPYSDPLADGPTIQKSGQRAIKNGMTLDLLFEQIKTVRSEVDTPLVLMGYFNQVMQYGESRFFQACAAAGVDGLILPDLPVYEYENLYRKQVEAAGLTMSFLITPQTSEARIREIDNLSNGFIYMVSNASITGAKRDISSAQIDYFQRIEDMNLKSPRMIGFGISSHETFATACTHARGAIIGSAFINMLENADDVEKGVEAFVSEIRGVKAMAV
ncbi:MAG: tryptophan synthase subunit alpha [Bacteroidota bacterium]